MIATVTTNGIDTRQDSAEQSAELAEVLASYKKLEDEINEAKDRVSSYYHCPCVGIVCS